VVSTSKTITCTNCSFILVQCSRKYYACPRCDYCDACAESPCLCPADDISEMAEVLETIDLASHAVSTLNEKLFMQEDDQKDVALSGDDGSIRAHSFVLSAASDAFTGILKNGTEKHSGTIHFTGVSVVTLKVFLRLLYTGCISKDDWEHRDEGKGEQVGRIPPGSSRSDWLPLNVLLDVTKFSKQYMANTVLPLLLQVLKVRLANSRETYNMQVFLKIFSGAIKYDLRPILMAGLEMARHFHELKVQYDSQSLSPEVAHELLAIWPLPTSGHKRPRLF